MDAIVETVNGDKRGYKVAKRVKLDEPLQLPGLTIGAGTRLEAGVFLGRNVLIGQGCRIGRNVDLLDGVRLGDNVVLDDYVTVGQKTFIWDGAALESFVSTGAECMVGSEVRLDESVTLSARVVLEKRARVETGATLDNDVYVGADAIVGTDAYVGPHARIGTSAVVGNEVIFGTAHLPDGMTTAQLEEQLLAATRRQYLGRRMLAVKLTNDRRQSPIYPERCVYEKGSVVTGTGPRNDVAFTAGLHIYELGVTPEMVQLSETATRALTVAVDPEDILYVSLFAPIKHYRVCRLTVLD